jgi:hypothetical protein
MVEVLDRPRPPTAQPKLLKTSEADDFAFRLAASYNVAPQSMQPVVRLDEETGRRELALIR